METLAVMYFQFDNSIFSWFGDKVHKAIKDFPVTNIFTLLLL